MNHVALEVKRVDLQVLGVAHEHQGILLVHHDLSRRPACASRGTVDQDCAAFAVAAAQHHGLNIVTDVDQKRGVQLRARARRLPILVGQGEGDRRRVARAPRQTPRPNLRRAARRDGPFFLAVYDT